jgi:hypothetical protein
MVPTTVKSFIVQTRKNGFCEHFSPLLKRQYPVEEKKLIARHSQTHFPGLEDVSSKNALSDDFLRERQNLSNFQTTLLVFLPFLQTCTNKVDHLINTQKTFLYIK